MTTKPEINYRRIVIGGIVAGVIFFIVTGIINASILKSDFESWAHEMGAIIHPPAQIGSLGLWSLMCLIQGIAGVWIYALMKPHPGYVLKTALFAGFLLWVITKLTTSFDFFALGILPNQLITTQLFGGLFSILLGVSLGARVYKER